MKYLFSFVGMVVLMLLTLPMTYAAKVATSYMGSSDLDLTTPFKDSNPLALQCTQNDKTNKYTMLTPSDAVACPLFGPDKEVQVLVGVQYDPARNKTSITCATIVCNFAKNTTTTLTAVLPNFNY